MGNGATLGKEKLISINCTVLKLRELLAQRPVAVAWLLVHSDPPVADGRGRSNVLSSEVDEFSNEIFIVFDFLRKLRAKKRMDMAGTETL